MLLKTGLGVPLGVLGVLAMVVLPLPSIALDALFTFNIALSIVIVMSVFYVARPVEFGVFPTILLLATLLRLALNVASTRVVLLNGHTGAHAAGHVIESFGQFVIGGNFAVGVVVFVILTIINFVVVTKGSGRIVKFHWDKRNPKAPIYSRAFSADAGRTWEWNWYSNFTRR